MTSKKLYVCAGLMYICSAQGLAQEFQRIRLILGGGKSSSPSSVILFVEPSVRINKRITLGLRREILIPSPGDIGVTTSVNMQYYVFPNWGEAIFHCPLRLFLGVGISGSSRNAYPAAFTAYYSNGSTQNIYPLEINKPFVPGFYPRVGFEYKHLTFNLEYNFVEKIKVNSYIYSTQTAQFLGYSSWSINTNYLSMRFGLFIGGGRKRDSK